MKIKLKDIDSYKERLMLDEKSKSTIEKYIRDVKSFYNYKCTNKEITKEVVLNYKSYLLDSGYCMTTINSMIVSVNCFLEFLNKPLFKVKYFKVQKKVYLDEDSQLTIAEYRKLLNTAKNEKNLKLYYLIQTICATGIRVSEHKFVTAEAVKIGKAVIINKGKSRVIFINNELKEVLLQYCKRNGITSGPIFITRNGIPLNRSNIWNSMKHLCLDAKVDKKKVYPHNLRHLFALTYYRLNKDIVRLADILGHASIDTTRIYTMISERECRESLSKLNLLFTT